MRTLKSAKLIVALLVLLPGVVFCFPLQALTPEAPTAEFDQKIEAVRQAFDVSSVSVAVIQHNQLVYAKAFGQANIADHRTATTTTRYAVGSISKQFTAAALLLEQERGALSLNDPVSKFFPEFTRSNEITVRQLLSHTSGYEDYAPQDYLIPEWTHPITADALLNRWAKKPLNFDPGTRWQYSNTNFVLAGKILEKVSGQPLLSFLGQHFFRPLDMTTAGDCQEHSPSDATSYTRFALGPPRPVGREAAGWYFAAGELCMTASDLARWDIAFLNKQLLSPNSYEELTSQVNLKNGKATNYSLGLQIGDLHGTTMISHSGEVSGFLASNALFPTKGAAVIVLSNEDGVNLIGPLTQILGSLLIEGPASSAAALDTQVQEILKGLQQGRIDRSRFTANANAYFSEIALSDYRSSLAPMGKLQLVSRQADQFRGGMTHLSFRAHFERDSVVLNIYVLPDGRFEQFLVEEQP